MLEWFCAYSRTNTKSSKSSLYFCAPRSLAMIAGIRKGLFA